MVLLAALAAEVHGVEALVRVARKKLLTFDRDRALPGVLERREGVAGAGDELVQLEGEEAARVRAWLASALYLRNAREQQQVPKGAAARLRLAPGVLAERGDRLGERQRTRPHPALVDIRPGDAEARLDPDRQRMALQCGVGDAWRSMPASIAAPRTGGPTATSALVSVTRSSVSTMTLLSGIDGGEQLRGDSATTRLLSSSDPSLAIVAEVPMHWSRSGERRSRTRRTSSATSAPWRPR